MDGTNRHNSRSRGQPIACIILACVAVSAPKAAGQARPRPPATRGQPVRAVQPEKSKPMTEIQSDIQHIVGGHFTPDALSPEIHGAIASRAKARAKDYLDVFDSTYLGVSFDAIKQSQLYLPSFLELVLPAAPERAKASAAALLRMYDAVLVVFDHATDKPALLRLVPDETGRLIERLNVRRKELQTIVR